MKKNKSLLKRFKINALAYGYSQLVTLAIQFLQVPFFLKNWGSARYGEWIVITGLPTMLTLLDAGVSQASANRGAIEASAGNSPKVKIILQTSLAFSTVVGIIILLLSAICCNLIDWPKFLSLNIFNRDESNSVIFLMSIYLAVQLQGGVTDASFRFIDKAPLGAFLLANRRVADLITCITVLSFGGGAVHLASSMLGVQIIMLFLIRTIASKLSKEKIFSIKKASWVELKYIMKPSLSYLGFPLAQVSTLQGGVQILNQVAGAKTVVAFTMCRTLVRILIQLAVVINNSLKPEISKLAGQGKRKELNEFTAKIAFLTNGLALFIYATLILFGPWIIQIWGKNQIHVSRGLVALLGLHAVLNVIWYVKAAVQIATNKHTRAALIYCSTSVGCLIAWMAFSKEINPIFGASLLLIIPELIMVIQHFWNHGLGSSHWRITNTRN